MALRELAHATVTIVGAGRMGTALASALRVAGIMVQGPLEHAQADAVADGALGETADIVLLAVPDAAIANVAGRVATGRLVGHLSGATTLDSLAPHEAFNMHPLLTVTGSGDSFAGASAAIAGSTAGAMRTAEALAMTLGMTPFAIAETDRAAYHAAASIAANFVVTIEGFATDMAATVGVDRRALAPLVRAAVEKWAERGAEAALTGPVARGDDATVLAQRDAVAAALPHRLPLFDALVAATRDLAASDKPTGTRGDT
ncbi:Rossmann-like and DUF2520 domain-containing protein [Microbacterium sp. MPKO10]|uniref:Rossmann-like and DUF2520 domain-containing protein n=1 Tax=Microbacterium sp. MPKO10 TaxID=2989818 RepID=UPI002236873F|nr:Rossmann-like and DUF2520 domain-containing protein [Microbacterium sp. MPKO10]MCW4458898.1 DUF2520 domain-containing protein [Microbacterium sp. MPKO10]